MAYTYKGRKITGTHDGGRLTPNCKKNDTYLNTQTGHVYVCTEAHDTWANWNYVRTDVIGKPNQAVSSLCSPVRGSGGRTMTSRWSTGNWQKDSQNGRRMTSQYRIWQINTWVNGKYQALKYANELYASTSETNCNLDYFTIGNKTYGRSDFYPLTKRTISSISCYVYTKNSKGLGPKAVGSRTFNAPRKPVIEAPTFNAENGHLTFRITTNEGADYYERYDTRYRLTALQASTNITTVVSDSSSTSTDFNITYDAVGYMQMSYDDYIEVTAEAWARGYRGDSDHVTRKYYISYPAKASITNTDISSEDSTGKCTVHIKTNNSPQHPVDGVKLEYLANVAYEDADSIPADADWKDTGIVDDAECTALSVSVTELIPEKGKRTWLRLKTWHAAEERLYRYSEYESVLYKPAPTAQDDAITIISAVPAQDGKSIAVQLGWNASGSDDATGTELSWSDELDTWKSTKDPDKYEFTWSDGRYPATGTKQYNDSALITIKGLKEGERYYIKARRYLEGDTVSYSPYSDYKDCVTSEIPDSIVLTCDKFIAKGSSLPIYWTFSGKGIQTKWQIELSVTGEDESVVLDEGSGSAGSTQIEASRIDKHSVDDKITIRAGASTGSEFVWSDWKTVNIVSAPTLSVAASASLTAQPFSFTATASKPCSLLVIVSSQGISSHFPTGRLTQTAGDTIHSDMYEPSWSKVGNNFNATVTLPRGLPFWNGGDYILSVTAIDSSTGLNSETVENQFSVDWTNTAVAPTNDFITVTPIDETDDAGRHRKAVQIELSAPTGSSESDVYDIYRLSGDGAQLIGEGFPLSYTAVDEYAPYGEDLTLYYRIATRTADGDVNFADFEYASDGDYLRFDWDGYYFESPYSVAVGDAYAKSVDIRQHMDGSSAGYWNQNIERKGSLSTDVISIIQPDEVDKARQLGRYAGTVFVRTPSGSAYEADVQVTDLSVKNKAVYSVAFDAKEVGLTQEFMLPIPSEEEE